MADQELAGGNLPQISRRLLIRIAAASVMTIAIFATPVPGASETQSDPTDPFMAVEAGALSVAINAEGGESVTVDLVVQVQELERGVLEVSSELDGRFLARIESDYQQIQRLGDERVEWTCPEGTC